MGRTTCKYRSRARCVPARRTSSPLAHPRVTCAPPSVAGMKRCFAAAPVSGRPRLLAIGDGREYHRRWTTTSLVGEPAMAGTSRRSRVLMLLAVPVACLASGLLALLASRVPAGLVVLHGYAPCV